MTQVVLPDSLVKVDIEIFGRCPLQSVQLSRNMDCIPDNMFRECRYLKEIDIPKSVTKIGLAVFWDCDFLRSVKFEDPTNWYNAGTAGLPWAAKQGGRLVNVTDPIRNAINFKGNHKGDRFYKITSED